MSLIRYQLFCVYKKTGMKVGIFELKNNKVCFKYEFMDKQFTKVMKGITITMVFFSHVGNANNVRLFAPLGGVIFLILSGYGLNESAKKGFQAKRFWIKRITTVIVPYFLTRVIMVPFMSTITFKAFLLDVFCLKP